MVLYGNLNVIFVLVILLLCNVVLVANQVTGTEKMCICFTPTQRTTPENVTDGDNTTTISTKAASTQNTSLITTPLPATQTPQPSTPASIITAKRTMPITTSPCATTRTLEERPAMNAIPCTNIGIIMSATGAAMMLFSALFLFAACKKYQKAIEAQMKYNVPQQQLPKTNASLQESGSLATIGTDETPTDSVAVENDSEDRNGDYLSMRSDPAVNEAIYVEPNMLIPSAKYKGKNPFMIAPIKLRKCKEKPRRVSDRINKTKLQSEMPTYVNLVTPKTSQSLYANIDNDKPKNVYVNAVADTKRTVVKTSSSAAGTSRETENKLAKRHTVDILDIKRHQRPFTIRIPLKETKKENTKKEEVKKEGIKKDGVKKETKKEAIMPPQRKFTKM